MRLADLWSVLLIGIVVASCLPFRYGGEPSFVCPDPQIKIMPAPSSTPDRDLLFKLDSCEEDVKQLRQDVDIERDRFLNFQCDSN